MSTNSWRIVPTTFYSCPICGRPFECHRDLLRHARFHAGTHPVAESVLSSSASLPQEPERKRRHAADITNSSSSMESFPRETVQKVLNEAHKGKSATENNPKFSPPDKSIRTVRRVSHASPRVDAALNNANSTRQCPTDLRSPRNVVHSVGLPPRRGSGVEHALSSRSQPPNDPTESLVFLRIPTPPHAQAGIFDPWDDLNVYYATLHLPDSFPIRVGDKYTFPTSHIRSDTSGIDEFTRPRVAHDALHHQSRSPVTVGVSLCARPVGLCSLCRMSPLRRTRDAPISKQALIDGGNHSIMARRSICEGWGGRGDQIKLSPRNSV